MNLYEIKVRYLRQTGEDNPGAVTETYIVEGLTPSDAEKRIMDELKPFIFGEFNVQVIRTRRFHDIVGTGSGDVWHEGKVEMITVDDNGAEKRHAVTILVEAPDITEALHSLKNYLASLDNEIIAIRKSAILDIYRATV